MFFNSKAVLELRDLSAGQRVRHTDIYNFVSFGTIKTVAKFHVYIYWDGDCTHKGYHGSFVKDLVVVNSIPNADRVIGRLKSTFGGVPLLSLASSKDRQTAKALSVLHSESGVEIVIKAHDARFIQRLRPDAFNQSWMLAEDFNSNMPYTA